MRQKISKVLPILICIVIALVFTPILTAYLQPMEDISLNLSMLQEDGGEFSDQGWTVFIQEGETVTLLESLGVGGYTGLELGQTFYFSRVLDEEMDSPILQLGAANRNFSIFLDDKLIYTDCPELDNRIGYLTLPMAEWDRTEPLTVSLPANYYGKTLTIAQSFPEYTEANRIAAYPCDVMLYCGYAYESGLIAETSQTSFAAIVMFLVGIVLLISFLRSRDIGTLCICLTAFLKMSSCITSTSFFYTYFGGNALKWATMLDPLSAGFFLLFLSLRAGKYQKALLGITAGYGVGVVIFAVAQLMLSMTANSVPVSLLLLSYEWLALIGIAVALIFGGVIWRKENQFYRIFTPLALIFLVCSWVVLITQDNQVWYQIMLNLQSGQITYIYYRILPQIIYATLITALYEVIQNAWNRHVEKQLVRQQQELAYKSYEALRRQQEEVMMIRHDMLRHFTTLREMSSENQVTDYLSDLIGQAEKIRPVLQSGNEMLDIILNGKLSAAIDAGIRVEIIKAEAPEKLPLRDADLCSLIMNIVDNAVTAAQNAKSDTPTILLDIHSKGNFLAIICENTADIKQLQETEKKETVPKHGLGLKIIRNIAERYEGAIDTEYGADYYRIKVALPLI